LELSTTVSAFDGLINEARGRFFGDRCRCCLGFSLRLLHNLLFLFLLLFLLLVSLLLLFFFYLDLLLLGIFL
jgi:hypothetical protein